MSTLLLQLPDDAIIAEALDELHTLLSISDVLSTATIEEDSFGGSMPQESWFKLPKAGTQRQAVLLRLLDGETTRDALNDICDGPRVYELVVGGWAEYTEMKTETRRGDRARLVRATTKARLSCRLQPLSWFPGNIRPLACR